MRTRTAGALGLTLVLLAAGCRVDQTRGGIPAGAQATINTVTQQIAAGQFDEIYAEASAEWRAALTPEENRATLERLRTRLGRVETRSFASGREQRGTSGDLAGPSLVVTYHTTFARGTGMETFTLVERDGRWLLARYFVNSDKAG